MPDVMISPAGMRIMKLLVGTPAQGVDDLTRSAGVTRTAVTEQLNELVAGGLVMRTTERLAGRGRPRNLYSATDAAMVILFSNNQRFVVPAIWKAITDIGGNKLIQKVLDHVSSAVADRYSRKITGKTPKDRLREMAKLLREEGGLIDVDERNGQLVVHKRSCPFVSMVDETRAVCCLDQTVMTAVVGRPVRKTACRHEGSPCCTFEIIPDED